MKYAWMLALVVGVGGCAQSDGHRWTPLQISLMGPVQLVPWSWDVYGLRLDVLVGENRDVAGVDVGVGSMARDMYGIQAVLGPAQARDVVGLQIANAAAAWGTLDGLQVAGLCGVGSSPMPQYKYAADSISPGRPAGRARGAQIGIGMTYAEDMTGLQVGAVTGLLIVWPMSNSADRMRGVQIRLFGWNKSKDLGGVQISGEMNSVDKGRVAGLQIAGVGNLGAEVKGVQVGGIFNVASERMGGLQLGGVMNYARNLSGVQIGILNINRGKGLPFFPIINFGFGGEEPAESEPPPEAPRPIPKSPPAPSSSPQEATT